MTNEGARSKRKLILVVIVYLAGIFMGAIDTGIVTPARTIIQNQLGVDEQTGIWMITIYTLAYASSIPIMGKLADRYGRKYIYLLSIFLFGLGSLFCGLSQSYESFTMMLLARAVQAIGGGGIVPIATAEFGTSFPLEKRGVALGLVGGVYGIANIFGASAGSGILDAFGTENWSYIFYINLPITLLILIAGFFVLENKRVPNPHKIDLLGIVTLTTMILSLLYGLKNLDFFDISQTIGNPDVMPFLLLFLGLLPLFILIELKSKDPVMNLKYFLNVNILMTMLISMATGISLMGVIFVPQFSENALRIATGSGGYLVIILGLFAGVGAPISGKLIDKYGVKQVLGLGFIVSIVGALFMIYVTVLYPNLFTVIFGLMLIGTGMGFTMGTPLNYMMLKNTDPKEANSALAALSLVRSIGTAVAPAIMIGFIAHAGMMIQDNVMELLPKVIQVPPLLYAQEIDEAFNDLKKDDKMKDKLAGVAIPKLSEMQSINIDFSEEKDKSSEVTISDDLLELMKTSDVTTIVSNAKTLSAAMFDQMMPKQIEDINKGISKGEEGIQSGIDELSKAKEELLEGYNGLSEGVAGMKEGISGQRTALKKLTEIEEMFDKMPTMTKPTTGNPTTGNPTTGMPPAFAVPTASIKPPQNLAEMLPPQVLASMPAVAVKQLKALKNLSDLKDQKIKLTKGINELELKLQEGEKTLIDMKKALNEMKNAVVELEDLKTKMVALKASIPSAFEQSKVDYLKAIDDKSGEIEAAYQRTLNTGFKNVYWMTLIASLSAMLMLLFYSTKKSVPI